MHLESIGRERMSKSPSHHAAEPSKLDQALRDQANKEPKNREQYPIGNKLRSLTRKILERIAFDRSDSIPRLARQISRINRVFLLEVIAKEFSKEQFQKPGSSQLLAAFLHDLLERKDHPRDLENPIQKLARALGGVRRVRAQFESLMHFGSSREKEILKRLRSQRPNPEPSALSSFLNDCLRQPPLAAISAKEIIGGWGLGDEFRKRAIVAEKEQIQHFLRSSRYVRKRKKDPNRPYTLPPPGTSRDPSTGRFTPNAEWTTADVIRSTKGQLEKAGLELESALLKKVQRILDQNRKKPKEKGTR